MFILYKINTSIFYKDTHKIIFLFFSDIFIERDCGKVEEEKLMFFIFGTV